MGKGDIPISIKGKLFLHALDDVLVLKEQNSACAGLEPGHAGGRRGEVLPGDDGLEDGGGDVPELVVLGAEEDDDAVGLGVEGRGDVEEGFLYDFLDAVGRYGEGLVEGVDCAAGFDVGEEAVSALDGGGGFAGGKHLGGSNWCGDRTGSSNSIGGVFEECAKRVGESLHRSGRQDGMMAWLVMR